uniref:Uncharacterized protein n=1 Tax=Rhizophora mucronata TaxID=61149 RepID=A0A2P2NYR2_RHIMU
MLKGKKRKKEVEAKTMKQAIRSRILLKYASC